MPGLFISCPVTQNKGRITIPLCEAQMNTFRGFESQCKFCLCGLLWPEDPWLRLYSRRQQSSVMAGGPLFLFPRTAKTDDEPKRLCG